MNHYSRLFILNFMITTDVNYMLSCGVQGKGFLQIIFSIGIFTPALDRYMTFPNKVIHSFIKNKQN